MSNAVGAAYGNNGEIYGAALGNMRLDGAALGDTVIWQQGPELYETISVEPTLAQVNQEIVVTALCNSHTKGAYLTNEYGGSIGIWDVNVTQSDDGYILSLKFNIGTAGNRTMTLYGTAIPSPSSDAPNNLSLNSLDINVTIVTAVTTDAAGNISTAQYIEPDGHTATVQIDNTGCIAGLAPNICLMIDNNTEVIQDGSDA